MAEFDQEKNTLTIKVVYYGPALSGKTTNLVRLHDLLNPELISDMMVLETKDDRTLFFDLLPLGLVAPSGLLIKLKLFTVPGQVVHDSTRKAILSRADGVIFVADSQLTQAMNNAQSFENLMDNAQKVGLDMAELPLVIQFNKRDLDNITSQNEVENKWGNQPWPVCFSNALLGPGVIESLRALLTRVYQYVDKRFDLQSTGLGSEMFIANSLGQGD